MLQAYIMLSALLFAVSIEAKPRAREAGVPFEGTPGALNAITDVAGVEVGFHTLTSGAKVRTGVTALLPRGKETTDAVFAGFYSLNGNGEMTGTTWLDDSGLLEGPLMITNTHSVGVVRDAVIKWRVRKGKAEQAISLPVVAETWDGFLNDINGFHVKEKHAWEALENARGGKVAEGNVGGGNGMVCFEFKCGTGTASRKVKVGENEFTVGVLVQSNFGLRHQLLVAGLPIGKLFPSDLVWTKETGSIIAAIATDAPLLPHQLKRVARRGSLGIARTGSMSGDGSGDLFLAFSTVNPQSQGSRGIKSVKFLANADLDPLFSAAVQGVEEAVINALFAAETTKGIDGHKAVALPVDKVLSALKKEGRVP